MSHAIRSGQGERSSRDRAREPLSLHVARNLVELEPFRPQLEELALDALEPNPFYEPWMLFPALRELVGDAQGALRLVLLRRGAGGASQLVGFLPLELAAGARNVPLATLRLLGYPYAFLQKPLVRRGAEREVFAAFFDWMRGAPDGVKLVELAGIGAEGPLHRALLQARQEAGLFAVERDRHARAFFRPAPDAETYLRDALGGKRLKELRRQERRLEEEGPVEFRALTGPEGADAWIDAFLRLEASGWKGSDGGAFLTREADARFFREIAREGLRLRRLRLLGLVHRGELVAVNVNLLAGDGAFAFKTAYDERLARFAPGLLLELENLRRLHAFPDVRWMDSCALPGNETANRLFSDRTLIQTVLIGCRPFPGGLAVSALPLLQWGRRTAGAVLGRLRGER